MAFAHALLRGGERDALAQYQAGFEPDGRHIRAVTKVRRFETRHPSPRP